MGLLGPECDTCMVSALSAMLGLKLNHVTKRGARKIAKLHECKHLRAHHSGTKSHILSLDAHETAVRYCTILENTLLQSTRGIIRKTFVIITIMLHLTMPGQSPAKGYHQNGAAREVVWLQPHRTYFGKIGMCSQKEPAIDSAAFSTQKPLPQADYNPWDVCPWHRCNVVNDTCTTYCCCSLLLHLTAIDLIGEPPLQRKRHQRSPTKIVHWPKQ